MIVISSDINESVLRKIFDSLYDGAYFIDKNQQVLLWNKSAEEITGYSAEELLNTYCFDNTLNYLDKDGNDLKAENCPLHQTLFDKKSREAYLFIKHKEGYRIPIHAKISPIMNDNGFIIGAVQIFCRSNLKDTVEKQPVKAAAPEIVQITSVKLADQIQIEKKLELLFQSSLDKDYETFSILITKLDDPKKHEEQIEKIMNILAKTLSVSIGETDLLGRWENHSLLIISTSASKGILNNLAYKLRNLISHTVINTTSGQLKFTISTIATIARKNDTKSSIFERITSIMKKAESKGNNQIVIDTPEN